MKKEKKKVYRLKPGLAGNQWYLEIGNNLAHDFLMDIVNGRSRVVYVWWNEAKESGKEAGGLE